MPETLEPRPAVTMPPAKQPMSLPAAAAEGVAAVAVAAVAVAVKARQKDRPEERLGVGLSAKLSVE